MTESNPTFEITGMGGNNFKMAVERFFGISSRPRKVVVIGKITEGEIKSGDGFLIKSLNCDEFIMEKAIRIEVKNKAVPFAVKNQEIGICLSKTSIKKLRLFNC